MAILALFSKKKCFQFKHDYLSVERVSLSSGIRRQYSEESYVNDIADSYFQKRYDSRRKRYGSGIIWRMNPYDDFLSDIEIASTCRDGKGRRMCSENLCCRDMGESKQMARRRSHDDIWCDLEATILLDGNDKWISISSRPRPIVNKPGSTGSCNSTDGLGRTSKSGSIDSPMRLPTRRSTPPNSECEERR